MKHKRLLYFSIKRFKSTVSNMSTECIKEKSQEKTLTFTRNEQVTHIGIPCCIMHTRTGCIPHLTEETLDYLDKKLIQNIYQVPLPSVIDYQDILEAANTNTLECLCMPNTSVLYATVQDFSCLPPSGYNTNKTVAVWGAGGKISVTPQSYMKLVEVLKPDIFQVLADGDVLKAESRKRIIKSVNRSVQYLDECIKHHQQSKPLENSKMICMIEGGNNLEERKRCMKLMLEKLKGHEDCVWGFGIDALPREKYISEGTKTVIKLLNDELPAGKPLLVHGFGHPLNIIDLIEDGVSVFDSTYVTELSESNHALVYGIPSIDSSLSLLNGDAKTNCSIVDVDVRKFVETIDISDSCFSRSFAPLVENCPCYTCVNHTRAYIQHLTVVNEMLAPVLLMLHNFHHHLTFFSALRNELNACSNLKSFKQKLIALNSMH
ncbi:unnamed protein product [Clavelina lepadiformis]|uniref:Queuine tRNA-ribosyltransferase accessory subunit 2 n=1 Tax=Clavelina lepadiformis TaxID=159417 RepID=A0ABP0GTC3_CLALP